jgi:tripartite-type tricarboxylate transporter receptor subunit TctC
MKSLLRIAAAALCLVAAAASAQVSDYPNRPLHLIVPYPPGGTTDVLARTIAQHLSEYMGQPVVVENRPGAGGNIGTNLAAKATPDGYTIVMTSTSTMAINPVLYQKLPFDPYKDLAPVALLTSVSNVLVVNPMVPAKTVNELVRLLKDNPDKYNFASPGNGNSSHLAAEMFKKAAGVSMTHVPYNGDMPAITDLIGGQVQLMFMTAGVAEPFVKDGRLRLLGVASPTRLPLMPDVPTISESGVPSFDANASQGIATQAAVPPAIINRLNAELNRALQAPDVRQRLAELRATPEGGSPQRYAAVIAAERVKWGKAVRDSGAHIE